MGLDIELEGELEQLAHLVRSDWEAEAEAEEPTHGEGPPGGRGADARRGPARRPRSRRTARARPVASFIEWPWPADCKEIGYDEKGIQNHPKWPFTWTVSP